MLFYELLEDTVDVVTDHLPLSSVRHLHTHYSFLSASVLLSFSVSANLTVRLCSLVPLAWGACFLKARPPSPRCSPPSDPWQPDKVNMTGFFPPPSRFLSPFISLRFFDSAQLSDRLLPNTKSLSSSEGANKGQRDSSEYLERFISV